MENGITVYSDSLRLQNHELERLTSGSLQDLKCTEFGIKFEFEFWRSPEHSGNPIIQSSSFLASSQSWSISSSVDSLRDFSRAFSFSSM